MKLDYLKNITGFMLDLLIRRSSRNWSSVNLNIA